MKQTSRTQKLTLTALFTAAVFAATFFLRLPVLSGFVHGGDGVILLASAWLGPLSGVAGAFGSATADLLGGYALYAPVTALVKGIGAALAGWIMQKKPTAAGRLTAAALFGLLTVGGYFLYETALFGGKTALAALPFNLLQVFFGALPALAVRKPIK